MQTQRLIGSNVALAFLPGCWYVGIGMLVFTQSLICAFYYFRTGPHDPIILLHASRAQKRHKELEADKTFSICAIFAIYALL